MPARIHKIFSVYGIVLFAIVFCFSLSSQAFVNEDKVSTSKGLAHYSMGQVYDLLGETESSILEYKQAMEFDESNYLIHLRLGTNYARLGMMNEAINQLETAQQLNSDDLQSHYLLAIIHSSRRDYDKAAGEYEFILKKFAKAEPDNVEVYNYLGQLYYSQRKYDQAIAQFEKILSLEPKNADIMFSLGSLYAELKQKDKAVEVLKKSLSIDPDHDGSLNTLGYLYAENDEHLDEAIDMINHALKLNPDNGAYLDSLGWAYFKKGMYEKAMEILKQADDHLKDPVIYDHLGDVSFKINHLDDAIHYWELSLKLQPEQEEILHKLTEVKSIQASKK